jgi:P-type Cu+ transporter
MDVVSGIELGRKTMAKIKQGFFWAFIYNLALLPIAAGILFPFTGLVLRPEYAGLAMSMSSVSVVTNALMLGRFKPKTGQVEISPVPLIETRKANIAIDPICKMDVDVETAELHSDFMGKRYYFCAPYCKKTFDSNPEAYRDQDVRA